MAGRFEGWYFKQQGRRDMLAVIPAVHTDDFGRRTGSVQVITPDQSWYIPLPGDGVSVVKRPFQIRAGASTFTRQGLELCINEDGLSAAGRLEFGPLVQPRGDIMGPYRYIPFMECRHSVFSMTHEVSGRLSVNGSVYDFSDGAGYMEGDRGRSFPRHYAWVQCCWEDRREAFGGRSNLNRSALMLSVADVRPLGREFIGVIGFVWHRGREVRLGTYRGARLDSYADGRLVVEQGGLTLTAALLENSRQALRAPASGDMVRLVKEGLCCRARFTLRENTNTIFDFITDQASFEYEF